MGLRPFPGKGAEKAVKMPGFPANLDFFITHSNFTQNDLRPILYIARPESVLG